MRRRVFALFLGVAVAGILSLPASAQQYPPQGDPEIILTNAQGQVTTIFSAGEIGGLFGRGLLNSTTYDLLFSQSPGVNTGNGTTNAQGELVMQFRIPLSAQAGAATVTLDPRGVTGNNHSRGITIRGAAQVLPTVGLPKTGSSLDLFAGSGTVLLLAGIVMLLFVRRRRHLARSGSEDRQPATVGA